MTFIEAKEFLYERHYKDCKTNEDYQKALVAYVGTRIKADKVEKTTEKLNALMRKQQRRNPTATPEAMNALFNEFGAWVKRKGYNLEDDFNPVEYIIMAILCAEYTTEK